MSAYFIWYDKNMTTRLATSDDKDKIIEMYIRSQQFTGIPDSTANPPAELGKKLYARNTLERYVTEMNGEIICHGLIDYPNSEHIQCWSENGDNDLTLENTLELGGSFVSPNYMKRGIWTALLEYRLRIVREKYNKIPVSATWVQNEHVKEVFRRFGGKEVGVNKVAGGEVSLFIFPKS